MQVVSAKPMATNNAFSRIGTVEDEECNDLIAINSQQTSSLRTALLNVANYIQYLTWRAVRLILNPIEASCSDADILSTPRQEYVCAPGNHTSNYPLKDDYDMNWGDFAPWLKSLFDSCCFISDSDGDAQSCQQCVVRKEENTQLKTVCLDCGTVLSNLSTPAPRLIPRPHMFPWTKNDPHMLNISQSVLTPSPLDQRYPSHDLHLDVSMKGKRNLVPLPIFQNQEPPPIFQHVPIKNAASQSKASIVPLPSFID